MSQGVGVRKMKAEPLQVLAVPQLQGTQTH